MTTQTIRVYKDLMGANAKWAERTRALLKKRRWTLLNFIGAPGAGKTAFLEALIRAADGRIPFAVLEGDIETTRDAERIAPLRVPVSQLLSGGACHLEARLVHAALKDVEAPAGAVVVVENVGNLVCPAEFDIGEHAKIAFLSVTEGEDKPLKYPLLFREAKAVVVTKTDLLPHLKYDLSRARTYIAQVNAQVPVFEVAAQQGVGVGKVLEWIEGNRG
jgi:hydrogenase nickel incorporation protein HypB